MLANFELLTVDPITDNIVILTLQVHNDYCAPKITHAKAIICKLFKICTTFK